MTSSMRANVWGEMGVVNLKEETVNVRESDLDAALNPGANCGILTGERMVESFSPLRRRSDRLLSLVNPARHLPVALWFSLIVAQASSLVAGAFDGKALSRIDATIESAIEEATIPGAVLWLESKGQVYHKAYGEKMVSPSREPMAPDTVFDVASLTKVLATTPAILHLIEQGAVELGAPVSTYLPEFREGGVRPQPRDDKVTEEHREEITVHHLLTHQSGLPPGIYLSEGDFWGYDEGIRRAATIGLIERPGTRFRYSDINFILLGEIVSRVSGQRLDSYAEDHFYEPLGMKDTGYLPPRYRRPRIAPTTEIGGYGLIRGEVHDPTARRMQGVAGHAGLFSTAPDIATFLRSFCSFGKNGGAPDVLLPDTVSLAVENHLPITLNVSRGLGWDIESAFACQRGEKFPREGYGHTGWTGTSIWVDPASETFLILLTNRNHPSEGKSVKKLRIEVGTLAAEAVGYTETIPLSRAEEGEPGRGEIAMQVAAGGDRPLVKNGVDVLQEEGFATLEGLTVGLITNQTGINRNRRSTIDLLAEADEVELKALFSPEHGIRGVLEVDSVDDGRDDATGLPVYSLYKDKSRAPTAEQMEGLDALVFDIQDIGCRFYTYISTMGLAMEAAAGAGIRFVVLDRVNPIGGEVVDGPIRTGTGNDFVAFHEIPVQHGMTVGELARMFRAERTVDVELTVIPVQGWDPAMHFPDTGLPWVNPSPNIRNPTQALIYPGVGLIEFTNVSVGRGTGTPFEHIGAPWIHEGRLASRLNEEKIPGVVILPTRFTPEASVYGGEDCAGVRFLVTDRREFRPVDLGMALMISLHDLYGDTFTLDAKGDVLLRHRATLERVLEGASPGQVRKGWERDFDRFLQRRDSFLLYPRR